MNKLNIFITGTNGFLASIFTKRLHQSYFNYYSINPTTNLDNFNDVNFEIPSIFYLIGSTSTRSNEFTKITENNILFHFKFSNFLIKFASVKIIFISAISCTPNLHFNDITPLDSYLTNPPKDYYSVSKFIIENFYLHSSLFSQVLIIRLPGLNSFNIYNGFLNSFYSKLSTNEDLIVKNCNSFTNSFTNANFVIDFFMHLIHNYNLLVGKLIINFGNSDSLSFKEICNFISLKINSKSSIIYIDSNEITLNYNVSTKDLIKLNFPPYSSYDVLNTVF